MLGVRKHATPEVSGMSAPGAPNAAIVFDIDGVLVHGMWHSASTQCGGPLATVRCDQELSHYFQSSLFSLSTAAWRGVAMRCHMSARPAGVRTAGPKPVPGAREALQRVVNARIPHVFVTNNGQQDEQARSARLQRVLDLPVDPARMILCQTPLKV
jgi:phosphoglycolate phosphatase-like HAD superfamily hydrolase